MHPNHLVEYLCVDKFLKTLTSARSLKSALELGLIDLLLPSGLNDEQLQQHSECPAGSLQLLLQLLVADDVLDHSGGHFTLSEPFRRALTFRDLLEAKLDFALLIAPDFTDLFTVLLENTNEFLKRAKLFSVFDYQRCFESTPTNYDRTKHWMRFTTALTRYEAPICLFYYDFSAHRRLLDIGGNSGEFAQQICKQHSELTATVCDLPVVCDIGQQHISTTPEAQRIEFYRANALDAPLPNGHDIVTFKSVLHDWPDEQAIIFLKKAFESLDSGGTLLIYERGPVQVDTSGLPFSLLPILLFFPFYRPADFYVEQFQRLGMSKICVHEFRLETPFIVVSGRKP
jgi:ubiquinone/menaquinone biosynthesis C-methylase UbiE